MRVDRLLPVSQAVRVRVSARLAAAVDRALAVDEADRPQSVKEWRAMLERPGEMPPNPPQPGPEGAGRKRWLGLVLIGLAVAALAVVLTVSWDRNNRVSDLEGGQADSGTMFDESADGTTREFAGMEFVWVPPGEFVMGSDSKHAFSDEQPPTRVRISRGYWLGTYEVTQGQWRAVMGNNPSSYEECGSDCPADRVSWEDAQAFMRALNAREQGLGVQYRLPTEAEWEYAARAGTRRDTYAGNLTDPFGRDPVLERIAWFRENSGFRPQPVGQKVPNAWGLHDMLGNVREWVQDRYGRYPGGSVTDPAGPGSGSRRGVRGGSWMFAAFGCRSSIRGSGNPGSRGPDVGFRLLRTE